MNLPNYSFSHKGDFFMILKKIVLVSFILLFYISMADAGHQNHESEAFEAIIRLEAGQDAINKRIDDVNTRIDDVKDEINKRIDDVKNEMNTRIDDMKNEVNKRFDGVNTRFDDLFSLILWGFGILFTGIFGLIGYIIWDRMHALEKIKKEVTIINKNEHIGLKSFIVKEIKKQLEQFSLKRKEDLPNPSMALA